LVSGRLTAISAASQVFCVSSSGDAFRLLKSHGAKSDDEASKLLQRAIRHLDNAGVSSSVELAKAIERLRRNASATAIVARRWLDAASQDAVFRWSLVYVLAVARHEAYLDLLRSEALRHPPKQVRLPGTCELSDSAELVIVMAIHGLEYLAQDGDDRAVESLLEVVRGQKRKWLREPAARAVVRVRPELKQRVEELLPADERYVVTLREATMEDFSVRGAEAQKKKSHKRRRPSPPPPLPSGLP
jgi:hypothetical protein